MTSATSYTAFRTAVTGLFAQPQLSSMPEASLPATTAHCSSASSTPQKVPGTQFWQFPTPHAVVAHTSSPRAIFATPQTPPQSLSCVQLSATQVPPVVQMPAAPGVVQTAPALPEF